MSVKPASDTAGPQSGHAALRAQAEALGRSLPPLLAEAEMLAGNVMMGEHGRRRAGAGDEFWQYRPAHAGDPARLVDWRRSARSDATFVREQEWQAAQSVSLWVDASRSMAFSGAAGRPAKGDRARLLALAIAVLLLRGGERVGLSGADVPPRSGRLQLLHIASALLSEATAGATVGGATVGGATVGGATEGGAAAGRRDYGEADVSGVVGHGRVVLLSDFFGDPQMVAAAMATAAARGARGVLLQILDPVEEDFPFDGRTIFESMSGALRHETLRADELRARYLARLAERKAHLAELARAMGWHYHCHHTGQAAQSALLWLWRALEGGR